jgi:hypothetical protein
MGTPSGGSTGRDSTARIAPGCPLEVGRRGLAGRSRSSLRSRIEAAASCRFLSIIGGTAAAAKV